ncbi:helix-turn-helix domain-containing protein [Dactylosporangium sp. CA-092794]|uniref:helix-turn-helix domain-containing protein n=1 Tax=Dactylosporangium sp. CA-092794 TaxID=3239929 RepID=UPI003D923D1F
MDSRVEIREFLTSRRARISPAEAGLPAGGSSRRVPGLRREELASLAGVSISYYIRLERGDATGVSDSVLDAISRALKLDDAERAHLAALVRATGRRAPRATATTRLRPAVQHMLDSLTEAPAIVHSPRLDIIGANDLARAAYWPMFEIEAVPNLARYAFLHATGPTDTTAWPDWDAIADQLVSMLRVAAGHDPHDRGLTDLVGELATRSDEFRRRWASHNVHRHTNGVIRYLHPEVGELTLRYESFDVAAEPGLALKIYNAEPGSPSAEALRLLATWYASRKSPAAEVTARDPG